MKKIIIAISTLLTTLALNVKADLPSKDLAVKLVRNDFTRGKVPTMAELKNSQTWDCTEFMATEANQNTFKFNMQFKSSDNMVVNELATTGISAYVISKDGLTGTKSNNLYNYLATIRLNANGNLLMELANNPQDANGIGQEPSVINAKYFVTSYSVCIIQK